jgi:uncharacterized protein (DUF342 family)
MVMARNSTPRSTVTCRSTLRVKVDDSVAKARITITEAVYTDVHFRFGDTAQVINEDLGPSVFLWVDGKIRYRAP